jgi:beta-glucosidase
MRRTLLLAALVFAVVAAPAAASAPYENPRLPVSKRVDDLLSRMTLEEKVGQMTQTERARVDGDPTPITTFGFGSILSGGGSTPAAGNTPEAWADMVDKFQAAALKTRLKIPLIYGVDSVHGHGNLLGATVFPHNIGLGATRDPDLVRRVAKITAEETRATGPQWTFSPCICAARDDRWGRTYESFSEDARLVEKYETAIDGYHAGGVIATAKHYAGDGDTEYGTPTGDYKVDQGIAVTSHEDFWRHSLRQYVPAIQKHGVETVMPSFSSVDWTDDNTGPLKMHAHKELLTDVLKGRLGFKGFVISDWEAIHQIPGDLATQVRTSVNAGVDMFMEPNAPDASSPVNHYESFITTLLAEVRAGRVPQSRVDDAVRRILRAKFEAGLFEHPYTERRKMGEIGSTQHRRVARKAVAESQVLLKNKHHTLPLRKRSDVYVAGSNADNIGNQAGGWTLTWQGGSTNVIPGETILDGIERTTRGDVTFSQDASAPVGRRDHGVVVVGETPYAEGFGDVGGPRWGFDPGDNGVLRPAQTMKLNDADKAAVNKVCSEARDCTVIVVSGRPMEIEPAQLRKIDALVAAWLPGSEGRGVADPLFGRTPYTGKLSFTWPKTVAQEPINVGDANYDPLYPFGWGLRTR